MDKKVKILHILGSMSYGGIETMLLNYQKNINKKYFQMDYVTCSEEISEIERNFIKEGATVYHITRRRRNIFKHIIDLNSLLKEKRKDYQIVHVHMNNEAYLPLFLLKLNGYKIRIAHSHTSYLGQKMSLISSIKCKLTRMLANKYAACSISAADFLFGKRNIDKTSILHNCIDYQEYYFDPEIRKKIKTENVKYQDKFVIGYVSRFDAGKNHEFLCELAKRSGLEDCIFVFIGDGENKKNIEKIVKEMNLQEQVLMLGQRNDVAKLLNMFDVFVMPSEHEGFPMVLIEAQVNGLPCIISKYVSEEIQISDRIEFLDIKKENLADWEKSIKKRVGEKNRGKEFKCSDEYDIKHYIRKLEKYYKNLLREGK